MQTFYSSKCKSVKLFNDSGIIKNLRRSLTKMFIYKLLAISAKHLSEAFEGNIYNDIKLKTIIQREI